MARDLAIDLGTANTLVSAGGEGIVLNEPSVLAMNQRTGEVLALGDRAARMIGRTPAGIVAVRPLRQGAIVDYDVTQRFIRLILERVGVHRFSRPRVVICVPTAITPVERRAVTEAARRAGAAEAELLEQPLAAAVGCGMPIHEACGSMVVDIGGGTSECAILSLGGVVELRAVRVGSFDFDAAIQTFARKEFGLVIGEHTAEQVKVQIGSASPERGELGAEVRGRDLISGLPKTVVMRASDVRLAIDEPLERIIDAAIECVAAAPPELARDLLRDGIRLVGGGSLLRSLDRRLSDVTGLPVKVVDRPQESVVVGASRCLASYDALRALFLDNRRPPTGTNPT